MAGQRQVIRSESILPPSALLTHGRIFAGPGAGKTHFLVENVKSIIKNQLSKTNAVQKVLCITYTNAAVDEIANRLDNFSTACEVSTIHSFLIQNVIGPFQSDLRSLMQEDFSLEVKGVKPISSQIEGVGILHGIDKKEISQFVNDDLRPSETIAVDQFSKKMLGDIEVDVSPFRDLSDGALVKCSIKHSKQIDDRVAKSVKKYTWSIVRKLTHDEILYFGFRILQRSPVALLSVRTKFPYIFVDEFQDTSPVQTRILELIGERFSKIYVVGDLCQSIYSFQGAKPDDFSNFKIKGSNPIADYEIKENRRSTSNIVSFCNFLRQKEGLIQRSFRSYKSLEEKENCESEKIHFLIGGSAKVNEEIDKLHKAGAVILTRTWAATFQYIEGVSESQTKILTSIYFSYYNSPIDIHADIVEENNVPWVRAFRCIISLWKAYSSSSFFDLLRALKLYVNIEPQKFSPNTVFLFLSLLSNVFSVPPLNRTTVDVISSFNEEIKKDKYKPLLSEGLLGSDFIITVFEDGTPEQQINNVSALEFSTSIKLFEEVFSADSSYMTVHQAKGLEWDKVIVSVDPTRNDKVKLAEFFKDPSLIGRRGNEEFGRIFYVACSRAKTSLYIRIQEAEDWNVLKSSLGNLVPAIPFDVVF